MSKLIISVVAFGLVIIACTGAVAEGEKIKLRVYYETLCPDSKRFIRSQLHPTLSSKLGKYLDVEYFPYGKATHYVGDAPNDDKVYKFDCQHGKEECDGNKMHGCALKYIDEENKIHGFIKCSMSRKFPPGALEFCAREVSIGDDARKSIETCTYSQEGDEIMAEFGKQTHSLSPKLYFVPWITFNGKFQDADLIEAQRDLPSVLCRHLAEKDIQVELGEC